MYGTTHTRVISHLRRCGIKTRDVYMSHLPYYLKSCPDLFDYDKMYDMHVNKRLSIGIIADIYDCDIKVILTRLRKLNIPLHTRKNTIYDPNSKHNYEPSLSQRIRSHTCCVLNPIVLKRDMYRCVVCGSDRRLEVHHDKMRLSEIIKTIIQKYPQYNVVDNIDELYSCILSDPLYNDLSGLFTVCSQCHHKIHRGVIKSISSEAILLE
jgi:hypothetical protein